MVQLAIGPRFLLYTFYKYTVSTNRNGIGDSSILSSLITTRQHVSHLMFDETSDDVLTIESTIVSRATWMWRVCGSGMTARVRGRRKVIAPPRPSAEGRAIRCTKSRCVKGKRGGAMECSSLKSSGNYNANEVKRTAALEKKIIRKGCCHRLNAEETVSVKRWSASIAVRRLLVPNKVWFINAIFP